MRHATQLLLGHTHTLISCRPRVFYGLLTDSSSKAGSSSGADKTAVGLAAAMEEDRNAYSAQRAQDAAERKQWRGEQRDALDELLPKATAGRCGLCRDDAMCCGAVMQISCQGTLLADQELTKSCTWSVWALP